MKITHIYIYPIKSLGGISMPACKAEIPGFQHDRRWMLVDSSGKFLSQRSRPELALLQVQLQNELLKVYHKAYPDQSFAIGLSEKIGKKLPVQIWGDKIEANWVSPQADRWFSEQLGHHVKLVSLPDYPKRKIDKKHSVKDGHVSFADSMPYLLIGQASLDDLNSRLKEHLPMDRFRPNLVVSSTTPFAEDSWSAIKIGEVLFKVTKPCGRCVMTTVNQETGLKTKEPLYTLSKYRKKGEKVLFGQNLIVLNKGSVKVGDMVMPD